MSAPDGPTSWHLRCEVREQLIDYLRHWHPQSLPRTRVELVDQPNRAYTEDNRVEIGQR
jgi:hypothetical protein